MSRKYGNRAQLNRSRDERRHVGLDEERYAELLEYLHLDKMERQQADELTTHLLRNCRRATNEFLNPESKIDKVFHLGERAIPKCPFCEKRHRQFLAQYGEA